MPLLTKRATVTIPAGATVGQVVTVRGVGFRPKAVRVDSINIGTGGGFSSATGSLGWAVEMAGVVVQGCQSWMLRDGLAATGTGSASRISNDAIYLHESLSTSSTPLAKASCSAFDADGVDLTVLIAPSGGTARALLVTCLGGSSLDAELFHANPTTNTNFVLATAFAHNAALAYGGPRGTGANSRDSVEAIRSGMAVKTAADTVDQMGWCCSEWNSSTEQEVLSRWSSTRVLNHFLFNTTTPSGVEISIGVVSFEPAQITLNRASPIGSANSFPFFLVALRADGVDLLVTTARADAGTIVRSGLGFAPKALFGMVASNLTVADATSPDVSMTTGVAVGTNTGAPPASEQHAVAQTAPDQVGPISASSPIRARASADDTSFLTEVTYDAAGNYSNGATLIPTTIGASGYTLTQSGALRTATPLLAVLALGEAGGGGGGTTYPKSVAGGATPTGAVTPVKLTPGTFAKSLAGGSVPSGALTEIGVGVGAIGGGVTPVGTLAVSRVDTPRQTAGGATPFGTLAIVVIKRLTGGGTPTGTLATRKTTTTAKALLGGATPTGTVTALRIAAGGGRGRDRRRRGVAAILTRGW